MSEILCPEQYNYLRGILPETDELITAMRIFAEANRIPILYEESIRFLELLISIQQPKQILEIGMAIGYSTIRMTRAAGPAAVITALEKSPGSIKLASGYINQAGLSGQISIVPGEASETINRSTDNFFDFVFLDADKKDYKPVFDLVIPKMRSGAVIAVDNLLWHGYTAAADNEIPPSYRQSTILVREFNSYFLSHPAFNAQILSIGDGIGLAVKK